MTTPIYLAFDATNDLAYSDAEVTHLPKIYQNAPYSVTLRVRERDSGMLRDFSQYDEIKMKLVAQQGGSALLELSLGAGQISVESNALRLEFEGAATRAIKVPVQNRDAINELRFLHSISLFQNGIEVERFAHGHGFLVAAL